MADAGIDRDYPFHQNLSKKNTIKPQALSNILIKIITCVSLVRISNLGLGKLLLDNLVMYFL